VLRGRMAISRDLYDAASVDGAPHYQRFVHITVPLLANLYIISTLASTVWAFGDYAPVLFVSAGNARFRVGSALHSELSLCPRLRQSAAWDRGRAVGTSAARSGRDPVAAAPQSVRVKHLLEQT
jgi:ABC-type glycerol-3-phosphate transport system permease component